MREITVNSTILIKKAVSWFVGDGEILAFGILGDRVFGVFLLFNAGHHPHADTSKFYQRSSNP